jgi:hypothetical protein
MFSVPRSSLVTSQRPSGPEFFAGHFQPQLENVLSTFDLQRYLQQVAYWVLTRKSLIAHDSDIPVMIGKNIPGEVHEARQEHQLLGAKRESHLALTTEWGDIGFFPMALINALPLAVDMAEVRRPNRRNPRYGQSSVIYERLANISGNITPESVTRDIHYFLQVWLEGIAGLPVVYQPEVVHQRVLDKNTKNYPVEFFNGKDFPTGANLTVEEQEQQFQHSRKMLKWIRNHLRDRLGLKDRDYGLYKSDYQRYTYLIHDFRHSDQAYVQLQREYPQDPAIVALAFQSRLVVANA